MFAGRDFGPVGGGPFGHSTLSLRLARLGNSSLSCSADIRRVLSGSDLSLDRGLNHSLILSLGAVALANSEWSWVGF